MGQVNGGVGAAASGQNRALPSVFGPPQAGGAATGSAMSAVSSGSGGPAPSGLPCDYVKCHQYVQSF